MLALPGYEQDCAKVLFGHIAEHVEFDILELDGLPMDSPSAPWLACRFGSDAISNTGSNHDMSARK